jgi:pimeloyl-ACP methyl ester carboxylesterase
LTLKVDVPTKSPATAFISCLALFLFGLLHFVFAPLTRAQNSAPSHPRRISPSSSSLERSEFYDAPAPLPPGKPGQLIRFEPFDGYHISYEFSAIRILYHSRSAAAKDVAVSGVVLLPAGDPPAGGWPVIAWSHDFTGSARQCAPSLFRNLIEGPLLSMYVGKGYAVVVSDYAGLGTSPPHAAFDVRSNAMDEVYAVSAARAAVPSLGARWVAAGHSYGGLVAAGVAEEESQQNDPGFLGTVAISGVAESREIYVRLADGPSRQLLASLAHGIKSVFPAFQVHDMLTDEAMPLYQHLSESCDVSFGSELSAKEMLTGDWLNNSAAKDFFARNRLGQKMVRGPLLLISGDADPEIPSFLTAPVAQRYCQQKALVLFIKFPGLNARALIPESVGEQFSWIAARFAGHTAPSNCP